MSWVTKRRRDSHSITPSGVTTAFRPEQKMATPLQKKAQITKINNTFLRKLGKMYSIMLSKVSIHAFSHMVKQDQERAIR